MLIHIGITEPKKLLVISLIKDRHGLVFGVCAQRAALAPATQLSGHQLGQQPKNFKPGIRVYITRIGCILPCSIFKNPESFQFKFKAWYSNYFIQYIVLFRILIFFWVKLVVLLIFFCFIQCIIQWENNYTYFETLKSLYQ